MFMPTTMLYPTVDPIEERRITRRRPASRLEIARRVLRAERSEMLSSQAPVAEPPAPATRGDESDSIARVRLGISRALNAAADRIAPEAA